MTDRKPSTATGRITKAPRMPETASNATTKDAGHSDKQDANAYERGANAGKKNDQQQANPYPDGTHAAKTFEHGQLDAQKVRSSDKPPGR